jgi:hypothetical protein
MMDFMYVTVRPNSSSAQTLHRLVQFIPTKHPVIRFEPPCVVALYVNERRSMWGITPKEVAQRIRKLGRHTKKKRWTGDVIVCETCMPDWQDGVKVDLVLKSGHVMEPGLD